jgi:hypothetical protein
MPHLPVSDDVVNHPDQCSLPPSMEGVHHVVTAIVSQLSWQNKADLRGVMLNASRPAESLVYQARRWQNDSENELAHQGGHDAHEKRQGEDD